MNVDALLQTIPPVAVYLVVGLVIGLEKPRHPAARRDRVGQRRAAGIASHARHQPGRGGAAATVGAIVGDTIGYSIGHRYGLGLFERLGRRFPKHFGPGHVALAKRLFARWGRWAVFFGRFVALPDPGGAAGRRAEDAPSEVPGRQRLRRGAVGRRHHGRRVLPGPGRRTLAGAVLLDRPRGGRAGRRRGDVAAARTHAKPDRGARKPSTTGTHCGGSTTK